MTCVGCGGSTFHENANWVASDFFTDPMVIKLCEAIEANDLEAMQAAVDAGADINSVGKNGMTPLLWAFPDHKLERFEWLLKRGADPNVCWTGYLVDKHPSFRPGWSMMSLATETKWPEYLPLVLKYGGNPNLSCRGQREPLIHVAGRPWVPNMKGRVRALIEAGADINAVSSGDAPLTISSASTANFELTLMLLKLGADPDAYQEKHNRQLVHRIIENEKILTRYSEKNLKAYYEIVEFLKNHGTDFDKARADLERWRSWPSTPAKKRVLREREYAERKAREAKQEKLPELAEPDS